MLEARETINQYNQLCPSINPYSSTSSFNEWDYGDLEQYDEESTRDETEKKTDLNFESQDPDFCRYHSVPHESFRTKTTDKPILKKPISFEVFPHVDTSDLIQELSDLAREADLHLQTLLEEQLNDLVLQVVRKWVETSDKRPRKTPAINQLKALLSFYNKFEQLFIEQDSNFLRYRDLIQDTCKSEMKICVSLSLFLPLFASADTHSHSGHPGKFTTFENIRQFFLTRMMQMDSVPNIRLH